MKNHRRIKELMKISEDVIRRQELIREYDEVSDTLSQIMPTVAPIPKSKKVSASVIKKVLRSLYGSDNMFDLGDTVRLDQIPELKDRIRFYEFYLSFENDFEGRGFNFEGLLAGLFNGEVITGTRQKDDVYINNTYYSVKLSQPGERYDLGTLRDGFSVVRTLMQRDGIDVSGIRTPVDIMRSGEELNTYKVKLLESSFSSSYDPGGDLGWIFAKLTGNYEIVYDVYSNEDLIGILLNPENVMAGKQSGKMSIAVPQEVVLSGDSPRIIFPKVSRKELQSTLYRDENKRMDDKVADLFGPYKKKIRFDILNYIRKNPELFLQRVVDLYGDRLRNMLDNRD